MENCCQHAIYSVNRNQELGYKGKITFNEPETRTRIQGRTSLEGYDNVNGMESVVIR